MKLLSAASSGRSPEKVILSLLAGYVVFLSSITVLAIAFSAVHLSLNRIAALSIVVVSLLGGCACTYGFSRNPSAAQPPITTPRRLGRILWLGSVLCFSAYVVLWLVSYFTTDLSGDGNFYHLPAMSLWAQEGRIHWVCPEIDYWVLGYVNGYAKGGEVIGYIMTLGFGNFFANTINCFFLPLGVLGIAHLAQRMGASTTASVFAGMLYILVPVNIWQAPNTYVDSAFASCVIAFFAFFHRYIELFASSDKSSTSSESWTTALLTGAALGLTLGVKGNGVWMVGLVFAGLGMAGLFFIYRFWIARSAWGSLESRRRFIVRWFAQAGIVLAVCTMIGGFWYVRNYLRTGNPIYPLEMKIAGKVIFPGLDTYAFLEQNTPQQWQQKPTAARIARAWSQSGDYRNGWIVDTRLGGLGFFWLLGCVPAIAFVAANRLHLIFRQREADRQAENNPEKVSWGFLVLFGATIIFFLFTPANWWARYTLWIYGLGLPCFAAVLTGLMNPAADSAAKAAGRKHFSAQFAVSYSDSCANARFCINCPLPWRKTAILWLSACLLVVFAEGFLSLKELVRFQQAASKKAEAIDRGVCAYWYPELKGTRIPQILAEGRRVAYGISAFSQKKGGNAGVLFFGVLSQPVQSRRWGLIDYRSNVQSLKKFQAGEFEYLLWDNAVPLPEEYARLTKLEDSQPGFLDVYRILPPVIAKAEDKIER